MLRCLTILSLVVFVSTTASAQGEKKLSLQEAVKAALESNLDLQLERLNVQTSNIDLDSSKTKYEPVVTGSTDTSKSSSEASNGTEGDAGTRLSNTSTAWDGALSKREWWGFDWELSSNNGVNESTSKSSLGQSYSSALNLRFNQKLLKGFSWDKEVLLYDEYIAISNQGSTYADLESRINGVLQNAENAYWDLVLSIEQLEVNKKSLELANALYEQNKTKVDVGTLPPIDLINTQATIANREKEIVTAENSVKAAEDALKKIMNLPLSEWTNTIIPTDRIHLDEVQPDFQKDVEKAFTRRAEVKKNEEGMRRAILGQKLRKNELRPDLTFGGGYGLSGRSTPVVISQRIIDPITGLPVKDADGNDQYIPIGVDGPTYQDAVQDVLHTTNPGWSAKLAVTWSPFNKAAKVNMAYANVAIRREELAGEQTKLQILEEVRAAVRELEASKKSIEASEKTVELFRENLKAEEQKFKNGLSTNYFVAEKQNQLVEQETSLIQAKIGYIKAIISYEKATGVLLEKRHINVK